MPKIVKLALSDYFRLPNPGLRNYLHKCMIGNDQDYLTPLGRKFGPDILRNIWMRHLEKETKAKYPWLYSFECDMATKFGPLSIQKPLQDRMESIVEYFNYCRNSLPLSSEAISATVAHFQALHGIRPRSLQNTLDAMRLNTNSGCPYFTKRSRVWQPTLRDAQQQS